MNSQRKLIDGVGSFSPARENWVDKSVEALPNKVSVHFKSGQVASLDLQDPLSAHWARMIDRQTQANLPVYVEIDEESAVITGVLIPRVFTVEKLETDDRGNLRVQLHQSQAIHALLHTDPDFEVMRDSLQAAHDDGSERLITSTRDDLEIIDVRTLPDNPDASNEDPPSAAPDPPVTPERADDIFDDMDSESCVPCNPSSTCIPFKFPDYGCQIRAHLMAYKMRNYTPPEDPEKIYIRGSLDPFVPNHPDCRLPLGWGWHIAPTLMVSLPGGDEKRVIDPSLASAPVSETEWVNLNNPLSSHTLTTLDWTVYNPVLDNTASEAQAQEDMQHHRNELQARCLIHGPPPYSCVKNLFFIMDRNTISDDEVEAMLLTESPAHFSDAFYIVLEGYRPDELGFTEATLQHEPSISVSPSVSGMVTLTADRIEFEYPDHLNRRQRLTWVYHIDFTDTSAFTDPRRTITLEATMDSEVGTGILYLIQQQNPYEIDGSVSWLSTDLRVFQIRADQSRFGANLDSGPNQFIMDVIDNLNANTAGETFDDISTDQQTSRLELSQTVDGTAVYNFAVARVRYRSTDTDATDVRVFFRLFPWETSSVEYNQATGYRRYQSGSRVVPLLGKKDNEVTAIPCFASLRINSAVNSMNDQTDAPNVQTIPRDMGGAEVHQYFGCWLDINQTDPQFPLEFPSTDIDGPYSSGRQPIQEHIRGEHQCLVAEIAFLPAPAQQGSTPANSDKLAQRNLAIVPAANPGIAFSRRIPQTFEVQPSLSTLEHDELMIDWGNVPAGSLATVYLPGIDSREVLTLASCKYRHHRLKRIDEHTIKFETGGINYLPIPFVDGSFPGLLTIDLPEGIKDGEVFKVVVRQVSGIRLQYDLRRSRREKLVDWRHIVGSWQLTIPVRKKADILPAQQRLLSNLRWIERSIPTGNRWVPVFGKYVGQVADRVDALGGDSSKVAPSASGQWQQAYRICRLLSLISALLIVALVVGGGTQTGGVVVLGGIPLVALLAGTVYLWRKRCRPTNCQLLRALLVGSGIGAIILALLAVFWISTMQLITTLIVSVGVAVVTAIVSWVKGCFR
ncbi:MAG: hypothetical protein JRD93_10825 [Deltaproteobacteria bacterium]|nr:hypothetical protein [Deltaproteobacteria bacterium]